MPAKYQLKTAKSGQFHFNLLAANGQTVLSSEMYEAKASALNGIASVQKNSPDENRYESKTSTNGKFYFVLKAGNNQVIGNSEMYESASSRDGGIQSVQNAGLTTEIDDATS